MTSIEVQESHREYMTIFPRVNANECIMVDSALRHFYQSGIGDVQPLFDLAADGSPLAMYLIAGIYHRGQKVEIDYSAAVKWYKRAADGGVKRAFVYMARIYAEQEQYDRAYEAYDRGASLGYAPCLTGLASMFFLGRGTEINLEEAERLWSRAITLGNLYAKKSLGVAYFDGTYGKGKILQGWWMFWQARIVTWRLRMTDRWSDRLV